MILLLIIININNYNNKKNNMIKNLFKNLEINLTNLIAWKKERKILKILWKIKTYI